MAPTCPSPEAPSSGPFSHSGGPPEERPPASPLPAPPDPPTWTDPLGACPSGAPPHPRNPCRPAPTWPGPRQLPGSWESAGEAPHTFQELDLIHSCLCVMPCALHHFQGHEALAPATRTLASAASPSQTHGDRVVAATKPRGRIPAGAGPWGAKGTLTGCPSTARQWRSGPSPACAPRGTVH